MRIVVSLTALTMGCASAAAEPVPPRPCPPPDRATTAPAPDPAAPLESNAIRALALVRAIHGPKRAAVYATLGDNFRAAVSAADFEAIAAGVDTKLGKLVDARFLGSGTRGSIRRVHVAAFFERGVMEYRVSFDEGGVVRGLSVKPFVDDDRASSGPADDYIAKRVYALPATGSWTVGNGGRDPAKNNHVGNTQQWYAFDLMRNGADGKSHTGDGKRNEDYLAWGQPVVAPADGVVVTVVDGVPDHGPDDTDKYLVPGNLVVIDHGDGEHSFLAHFQRGSVVVKPGAEVKQGQLLGKVGNSGNTSEPHIHWHLASAPAVWDGHGLPIRFAPLIVNGVRVESPAPAQDDVLAPP